MLGLVTDDHVVDLLHAHLTLDEAGSAFRGGAR
jgi:hypothetical protein